ncbi:unnamed protein product [Cercopithifilaria johnstoni]|uniref:Uncharacterized protein n=1 Tax=Cercopithifilaria johnstoni TaxID=2874296 RepID=A0A8J2MDG4_9BILA|nr:unnamed protein product [Cercopithifilaria johnstoni]
MSAPPPFQAPQYQYPSPQNYGAPGYCYSSQPCYGNQPQPTFGYGYGQQPPIIQTIGPPQSSRESSNKCCLWTLLGCCFGCGLAECCC